MSKFDVLTLKARVVVTLLAFALALSRVTATTPSGIKHEIVETDPEVFIWLGDVVYADTRVMPFVWRPSTIQEMRDKFDNLKLNPEYEKVVKQAEILGIWDDHDYGMNNGGNEYEDRKESQKVFLDFLDEPQDSERRHHQDGIYASYTYGKAPYSVKVILLDVRYHRDSYDNEDGDVLGEAQWGWLEEELDHSDAALHIIGSGVQVIADDRPLVEAWGSLPQARKRLFQTLEKHRTRGVIFLSGDVHFGEILRTDCDGVGYPIHEVVASGLTHSCMDDWGAMCQTVVDSFFQSAYQVAGGPYLSRNFGSMDIDWDGQAVELHLHNIEGEIVRSQTVNFDDLSPHPDHPAADGNECSHIHDGKGLNKWMWWWSTRGVLAIVFMVTFPTMLTVAMLASNRFFKQHTE